MSDNNQLRICDCYKECGLCACVMTQESELKDELPKTWKDEL